MTEMKITLTRIVPGALRFESQHAQVEVLGDPDTDAGLLAVDAAKRFLNTWASDTKELLPEHVLTDLGQPRMGGMPPPLGGPPPRTHTAPQAAPPSFPASPAAAPRSAPPGAQQRAPGPPQAGAGNKQYPPPILPGPSQPQNGGFDSGYYERLMAEIGNLTGLDRANFERDFVRAASAFQNKDGGTIASSANTLYELDGKAQAKRAGSTWAYDVCERLGKFVAALKYDGMVTLTVPKWERGNREIARWDTPSYYARGAGASPAAPAAYQTAQPLIQQGQPPEPGDDVPF